MFDDPIHIRWLDGRPWWSVWTDVAEMQHYRPLVMTVWALAQRWFPHNAVPLHLFTLALHVANATLCGFIARDFTGRRGAALAATALFAAYPFDYQALPSPGSLSKPMSAFLVLLAATLYLHGRTRGHAGAKVGAYMAAVLAPFAYESAATSGGFLLLCEYALWRSGRIAKPDWRTLALPMLGIPFVAAWKLVPSTYEPLHFPGWESLWQSSVYFRQALTWPAALLAHPLMRLTGLSDGWATWLVTSLALAALVITYWRRHRFWLLVSVVAWLVLSVMVQWTVLTFRYIIDSPRMLYLGGSAFALLAADLLVAWPRRPWARALGTTAAVAMVAWGGRFAQERVDLTAATSAPLAEAAALASQEPDSLSVFVNVPRWYGLAADQSGFALGHEGYTVYPTYYSNGLSDVAWANTGGRYKMASLAYPNIRQEWRVNLGYGDDENAADPTETLQSARAVYALDYQSDALTWRELGGAESVDDLPESAPVACYDGGPCLLGVQVTPGDDSLRVELLWRVSTPPSDALTVFVHLYRADGTLSTQDDGEPYEGLLPFSQWLPGSSHRDVRKLSLEGGNVGSGWTIGIGLYRPASGERLAASDGAGHPLADQTYRVPLQR